MGEGPADVAGGGVRGPSDEVSGAGSGVSSDPSPAPASSDRLRLGTYRDLWAGEVTERNEALRFLVPEQRVELAPADADRLGINEGDEVAVRTNGHSRPGARGACASGCGPGRRS